MPLNISETARVRDRVGTPARPWTARLGLACSIATLLPIGTGCQLIMADIARPAGDEPAMEAGIDAGTDSDADASMVPPTDAPSSDGAEDAMPADAAPDATEAMDAQPDAARDTGLPDPEACDGAGEKIFYRDSDRDGHGNPDDARIACEAPANFVEDDGDCEDRNGLVFRGQTEYFGVGYDVPGSSVPSFDYDCDGEETAAPGQAQEQPCSGGGVLANCNGGGYAQDPDRMGLAGINPYCGSNTELQCDAVAVAGVCGAGNRVTTDTPFVCN